MFWKLYESIWDSTIAPSRVVKAYLTPIVQQAVEEKKQNEKDGTSGDETLLEHLIQSSDGTTYSKRSDRVYMDYHRRC